MSIHTSDHDAIKVVAGVVRDEKGRVLLVRKRGATAYMQPGGKPTSGECPLDTLAREIKEELGCEIDRENAEHFASAQAPAANEPGWQVEAELYSVSLLGAPSPSGEIEDLIWIAPSNPDCVIVAPLTDQAVLQPLAKI